MVLFEAAAATVPAATKTFLSVAIPAFTASDLILMAGVIIFLALIVLFVFRKFIVNTIFGVIALLIVNAAGVQISINAATLLVTAILGLVGVALLIILKLAGVSI
jgi:hypothetical protein